MRRTLYWKQIVVVVVAASVVGACSGGGGSGGDVADLDDDQQQLADVLATSIENEGGMNADEAQCWAAGVVSRIGVERLNELGLSVETGARFETLAAVGATQQEADQVTDALFDCADPTDELEAEFAQQVGAATASCVVGKLDDATRRSVASARLFGGQTGADVQDKVVAAITECASG